MSTSNKQSIKSDALVKKILVDKVAAQEFLNEYLPESIKNLLDLRAIQVEKEPYVELPLRRQFCTIQIPK